MKRQKASSRIFGVPVMAHVSEVEKYLQPRWSWNGKLFFYREGNPKEEEGKLLARGSRISIEAGHMDKRAIQRKVRIVTGCGS